ncbi:MAG: hypothetical protein JWR52_1399 [Marmoricola sp.]|nr:hypothetical protein [Marmoricola sp.]
MDELGRGWPEQYSDDKFIGLLRPGLDDSGEPCWVLTGSAVCRIGDLS